MTRKLTPHIVVELERFDGSGTTRYTATRYELADEDHDAPYIESWSGCDAKTGDDVEYRQDEEDAASEALDEALAERLAEYEDLVTIIESSYDHEHSM